MKAVQYWDAEDVSVVAVTVLSARKPPTPAMSRYNPESVYGPSVSRRSSDSKNRSMPACSIYFC